MQADGNEVFIQIRGARGRGSKPFYVTGNELLLIFHDGEVGTVDLTAGEWAEMTHDEAVRDVQETVTEMALQWGVARGRVIVVDVPQFKKNLDGVCKGI